MKGSAMDLEDAKLALGHDHEVWLARLEADHQRAGWPDQHAPPFELLSDARFRLGITQWAAPVDDAATAARTPLMALPGCARRQIAGAQLVLDHAWSSPVYRQPLGRQVVQDAHGA
jgi:hypothetical protein